MEADTKNKRGAERIALAQAMGLLAIRREQAQWQA
jgi:hypothetical protein